MGDEYLLGSIRDSGSIFGILTSIDPIEWMQLTCMQVRAINKRGPPIMTRSKSTGNKKYWSLVVCHSTMKAAVFSAWIAFVGLTTGLVQGDPLSDRADPYAARYLLTRDFEDGTMAPWLDQSSGKVNWKLESFDSPSESISPPPPLRGSSYLRVTRNGNLQSGLAILTSQVFTALPGDRLTFSFWIQSRHLQANTLEVIHTNGRIIFTYLIHYFHDLFPKCTTCKVVRKRCSWIWTNFLLRPTTIGARLPVAGPTDISVNTFAFATSGSASEKFKNKRCNNRALLLFQ